MKKINLKITIATVLMLLGVLTSESHPVDAATVTHPFEMPIHCRDCADTGGLFLGGYLGLMTGSIEKTFNFIKQAEGEADAYLALESTLNVGDVIVADEKPTTGAWVETGGHYDTPPMDGIEYIGTHYVSAGGAPHVFNTFYTMSVSVPQDNGSVRISSEDPDIVSCIDNVCTALKNGTTNIRVEFPSDNQLPPSGFDFYKGKNTGFGLVNARARWTHYHFNNWSEWWKVAQEAYTVDSSKDMSLTDYISENDITLSGSSAYSTKSFAYSFDPIEYTVVVGDGNTQPSVSCAEPSNVTQNSATINWIYEDQENDPQTSYQVQIFDNNNEAITQTSGATSATSASVSGLMADVNYRAVINVNNDVNETVSATCPFTVGHTCNNDYAPGQVCSASTACGSVPGTYSCGIAGWQCNPIEAPNCTPPQDVCSNIPGIDLSPPEGYSENGDGTCSPIETPVNTCSIATTPSTSHCVQLFDAAGNPTYEDAGISEAEYQQYYAAQVQSIYYNGEMLETDHSIFGIAASDASGNCQPSVCPPGELLKTGCINGAVAQCYTEDVNELNFNLQLSLRTPSSDIPEGGICTITWTSQDAQSCTLTKSGTPISSALAGQRSFPMGATSSTFNLQCTEQGTGNVKTTTAICRAPGEFSQF